MPLLPIFHANRDHVYALQIPQIVTLCGLGKLADNTDCSKELREYLAQVPSEYLFKYIANCLQTAFEKSGLVLQDLVNELGRRLDYKVEAGLYQGRSNAIGFDGIWQSPHGPTIIVEVKTTDTYRINLDTIAGYRDQLVQTGRVTRESSTLIVVGREDTGDLEAQVRGSKHAWDIRLISVDAMVDLVKLKEETEEGTTAKIHELLVPFEYTRLDRIIDVAFTAAKDVGAVLQQEVLAPIDDEEVERVGEEEHKQEHTPSIVLSALREQIVAAIGTRERTPLVRKSAALYWSADRSVRAVCSLSKRHPRGTYWYAYHPQWDRFLAEGSRAFYVLGCIGRTDAYALPFSWIHEKRDQLYKTERDGKMYWHVHLHESHSGELLFRVFKVGQTVPVEPFRLTLGPIARGQDEG